jgi:hypothetical protein
VAEGLAWYLADSASLLRDWGNQFTSQSRLTRWINLGRKQVCKLTGCLRALVPGTAPYGAVSTPGSMIPGSFAPGTPDNSGFYAWEGTERYSYQYANPFVRAANQGYAEIFDVFGVAVAWGSARPVLRWMPWDEMQAYCRVYSAITSSYPAIWSTFGTGTSGQVWLWPPPSQNLEMEWDATCLPNDLASNDDFDAVPASMRSAVKFYAAGMANLGTFRQGAAEAMFQMFMQHVQIDATAAEGGKVPDYYWTALATR